MCRRWAWGWRQEEEKTVKYRRGWNWTLTFLEWQISCPTSSWESQSSWKSPQSHWIPPWLISLAPGVSWGPPVSPSFASGTWYLEAQRMGVRRGKPLSLSTVWRHTTIWLCNLEREFPPESDCAEPLILDLQNLEKTNFCCLSHRLFSILLWQPKLRQIPPRIVLLG